jgi:hypothetical protein
VPCHLVDVERVSFEWEEGTLRVRVGDSDLAELVGDVERPHAEAEGHPDIAGTYGGLVDWRLRQRLAEHFLGGPDSHLFCGPHEKTVLLSCTCGEPGCWPLMARVELSETEVRWSDFEQPHRRDRWSYDGFGPIVFDRAQYEAALADAEDSAPA